MSAQGLEALQSFVVGTRFLAKSAEIANMDLDEILESLESDPFESNWLRVSKRVEGLRGGVSEQDAKAIDEIGKQGYLRTYELTANTDLAGCVCDDLELIASALVVGIEDGWLNGLWLAYRSGGLPQGRVDSVGGPLSDLL